MESSTLASSETTLQDVLMDRIIDERSYANAEVEVLLHRLPTITAIGRTTLDGHLVHGTTPGFIHARQDAVDALMENADLRETVREALSGFAPHETAFSSFMDRKYNMYDARQTYQKGRKGLHNALGTLATIKDAQDLPSFLSSHLQSLQALANSQSGKLLGNPVYLSPAGIKAKDSNWRFGPRLRYSGRALTGRLAVPTVASMYATKYGIAPEMTAMVPVYGMMFGWLNMMGSTMHEPMLFSPVRRKLKKDPEVAASLARLGDLDSLQALAEAAVSSRYPTTRPVIDVHYGHHIMGAQNLRNPLLVLGSDKEVVPNNVTFGKGRLTFLTGPNSGGKSTLSKAVLYNQLLAHAGSHVYADQMITSVADRVAYHIPTAPTLGEETGRFEHELNIVKPHFEESTANSLVILDDCLDGTTHEERVAQLKNMMLGFVAVGSTTIFSTHAHELAGDFEAAGVGQFLQVEFDAVTGKPTHRIKHGVSHTSHAGEVAARLGLDKDGIVKSLRARDIEPTVWF